jgi:hypothetical protein
MKHGSRQTNFFLSLCAVLLGAGPVAAEVTIEETLRLEGAGLMSMFNMSGTSVTRISGDRGRTDSDLQMASRIVRMVGGLGPTAEIMRLDEETLISLDLKRKTYSETTFEAQRAEMEQAMSQMRESQQAQQQGMSGIDESECEWSDATTSVERSGATATIGGYRAEQLLLTATQSCRDRKSGQVCDVGLRVEQWIAPEFEAASEVLRFYQAYGEKLGLDTTGSRGFAERTEAMFGGYEGIWEALTAHMQTLEGYPVKSSISLAMGGPECESVQHMQAAGSADTPGIGEAIGGALGGRLGGMLGRKRDDSAKAAPAATASAPASAPADSMLTFMTITNELVSVSSGPVAAETFEIPAGFRPARR